MAPCAFVKIAAINFAATVFDSDDLSTIRGSSLAVLRLPKLLVAHLQQPFQDRAAIAPVYASASEAVLKVTPTGGAAPPEQRKLKEPSGVNAQRWKRALQGVADAFKQRAVADQTEEALLELVKPIAAQFKDPRPSEEIAGQVVGLIGEKARQALAGVDPSGVAAEVATACAAFVRRRDHDWPWHRFTFGIAWHVARETDEGERLRRALIVLDNKLRTQQLQRLTLALPEEAPARLLPARQAVCRVTGVLPAEPDGRGPEPRSASVRERRRGGVRQKSDFYVEQLRQVATIAGELARELPEGSFKPEAKAAVERAMTRLPEATGLLAADQPIGFARNFMEIVQAAPRDLPPGAAGKLAVVWIDGNRFGARRQDRAGDPKGFGRFSRYLEVQGGLLLAELVAWMLARPRMRLEADVPEDEAGEEAPVRLRFETLLWGGDEMCFVLPAWEGWAFMAFLQDQLAGWIVPEADRQNERLSFAAGMVFGSAKTPIRDLKGMAEALCAAAKSKRSSNQVQVMTLEGVDRADATPGAIRAAMLDPALGQEEHKAAFNIAGSRWREASDKAAALARTVGVSQMHRHYRRIDKALWRDQAGAKAEVAKLVTRLRDLDSRAGEPATLALQGDLLAAGSERWPLLPLHQLLELWDFMLEPDAPAAAIEDAA
jgi:hypothetical protein